MPAAVCEVHAAGVLPSTPPFLLLWQVCVESVLELQLPWVCNLFDSFRILVLSHHRLDLRESPEQIFVGLEQTAVRNPSFSV